MRAPPRPAARPPAALQLRRCTRRGAQPPIVARSLPMLQRLLGSHLCLSAARAAQCAGLQPCRRERAGRRAWRTDTDASSADASAHDLSADGGHPAGGRRRRVRAAPRPRPQPWARRGAPGAHRCRSAACASQRAASLRCRRASTAARAASTRAVASASPAASAAARSAAAPACAAASSASSGPRDAARASSSSLPCAATSGVKALSGDRSGASVHDSVSSSSLPAQRLYIMSGLPS